jgi:lipopolysaccharide heptosyltransferase II
MERKSDWNKFKNILCVRPDNIGDVLMSSPAFRALKKSVPGRKITLLTSTAGAAIARLLPEIDEIIEFNPPWYKHSEDGNRDQSDIINELKRRKFDGAVIFTVYSQSPLPTAMLLYQAGINRTAAYCRENPYGLISEWIPDKEPIYSVVHEVERQLDLVKYIGTSVKSDDLTPPKVSKDSFNSLNKKLKDLGLNCAGNFIIAHPGVSEEKRQYDPVLFAEAIKGIIKETGLQVLVCGGPSEKRLVKDVASMAGENAFALGGLLTLEEYIALIRRASLLLSNNTGPVHIAAAVNTAVLVLYAQTNPQHTPWKVKSKVLYFDVPQSMRSKNVIVRYAYENCFPAIPGVLVPSKIIASVKDLLLTEMLKTETGSEQLLKQRQGEYESDNYINTYL